MVVPYEFRHFGCRNGAILSWHFSKFYVCFGNVYLSTMKYLLLPIASYFWTSLLSSFT